MKRFICAILIAIILAILIVLLSGCGQTYTRKLGGTMKIDLPANTKLELITWKDESLWYLTRPMRDDDIAETHTYQQSSEFGVFEGTVIIEEHKTDK